MPSKTQSIALGALIYAAASVAMSFIVLNAGATGQYIAIPLCCLIVTAATFTAVWHYTSTNRLTIPPGSGAGMGALVVAIGGAIAYGIQRLFQVVGVMPSDAEMVERSRAQLIEQGMDPAQIEQAMKMGEMFQGPLGFLINLAIAAVLGAIFGAIAASIFKKGVADPAI